ncbi:conjugal transfer protein TraB [Streptomyces heilongjiangensis]|uniref:Conjugal transfer protein TraB n=1 Tax=Streptomyces heilongjiangensis TaxID=945052 RepID=A0ABW1BHE8_9ACTN|nr:conjugal transfer protein TraB [Streptomyces heilongjiangensis]MDC2951092.1 conjugal transfer protein TraB [Streptomyces heilongjiangensis]
MSELVPRPGRLPMGSHDEPTFLGLVARTTALTTAALALKEGMWALRRRMESDARHADLMGDQCVAAEVEPKFTNLIHEAGSELRAVAEASGALANASDVVQTAAQSLHDAHQAEYRGVYEAVNSSGVQQAKPGFYRTR